MHACKHVEAGTGQTSAHHCVQSSYTAHIQLNIPNFRRTVLECGSLGMSWHSSCWYPEAINPFHAFLLPRSLKNGAGSAQDKEYQE
jgi:hypothetical protein